MHISEHYLTFWGDVSLRVDFRGVLQTVPVVSEQFRNGEKEAGNLLTLHVFVNRLETMDNQPLFGR